MGGRHPDPGYGAYVVPRPRELKFVLRCRESCTVFEIFTNLVFSINPKFWEKLGGPLDTLSGVEQNSEGLVECRKPIEDPSYGCAGIDENVFFKHFPKFRGAIAPEPWFYVF